MMLRSPTKEDFVKVIEIYRNNYNYHFDPFTPNSIIDDAVAVKDGKIIAYGMVKVFAEAVFLADPTTLRIERSKALKALMELAEEKTKKANIKELYTFTSNGAFKNLLKEQFGFSEIMSPALVKDL